MQIEVDVNAYKPGFGDIAPFVFTLKFGQISLSDHGL